MDDKIDRYRSSERLVDLALAVNLIFLIFWPSAFKGVLTGGCFLVAI